MEWQRINTDRKFDLQKQDYLYQHNKTSYPLKDEISIETMFLILEVRDNIIKILRFSDSKEEEIQYSQLESGYWYCFILPPNIRKILGI